MTHTMAKGWLARMAAAQKQPTIDIGGVDYDRVQYGREAFLSAPASACRDCAVALGQYHVIGCCVEACARCGGQALGCDCAELHTVH
jgi:hypothetical protein